MDKRILIQWPSGNIIASLQLTATTERLLAVLPIKSVAQTWGDDVYFSVPIQASLEADAMQVVEPGTIGFWTEGSCLAIPFGPTPIAVAGECRLAAPVNLLGRVDGDPRMLASIQPGDPVQVSIAE